LLIEYPLLLGFYACFSRRRRDGSAALDVACVAAGRLAVSGSLVCRNGHRCGTLLVEEAGGKVSDFYGHPTGWRYDDSGTNGTVHEEEMRELRWRFTARSASPLRANSLVLNRGNVMKFSEPA